MSKKESWNNGLLFYMGIGELLILEQTLESYEEESGFQVNGAASAAAWGRSSPGPGRSSPARMLMWTQGTGLGEVRVRWGMRWKGAMLGHEEPGSSLWGLTLESTRWIMRSAWHMGAHGSLGQMIPHHLPPARPHAGQGSRDGWATLPFLQTTSFLSLPPFPAPSSYS